MNYCSLSIVMLAAYSGGIAWYVLSIRDRVKELEQNVLALIQCAMEHERVLKNDIKDEAFIDR